MRTKRWVLINALEVAAAQFAIDARTSRAEPGHERIADRFEQQAREAHILAEQIEQADRIELED